MASSAVYSKNQNFIQDIKNGNIHHFDNYYKFLNGSLAKDSGEIKLVDGTAYLRERNLLVKYQSLAGNLNQSLEFEFWRKKFQSRKLRILKKKKKNVKLK